jgi:hypothetical protein
VKRDGRSVQLNEHWNTWTDNRETWTDARATFTDDPSLGTRLPSAWTDGRGRGTALFFEVRIIGERGRTIRQRGRMTGISRRKARTRSPKAGEQGWTARVVDGGRGNDNGARGDGNGRPASGDGSRGIEDGRSGTVHGLVGAPLLTSPLLQPSPSQGGGTRHPTHSSSSSYGLWAAAPPRGRGGRWERGRG